MPDIGELQEGDWLEVHCDDCNQFGCSVKHQGQYGPSDQMGHFCKPCWNSRKQYFKHMGEAKPFRPFEPPPSRCCE